MPEATPAAEVRSHPTLLPNAGELPSPAVATPAAEVPTLQPTDVGVERQVPAPPSTGKTRRWVLGAVAVAAAGALAVAGVRALRDGDARSQVVNGPTDVAPTPPSSPHPAPAESVAAVPPLPPPEAGGGTQPGGSEVANEPAKVEEPTPPRPSTGTLRVGADLPPGASVTVDGKSVVLGRRGILELPAGRRRIEVSAPGYQPASITLAIEAGRSRAWDLALTPVPKPPPPVVAQGPSTPPEAAGGGPNPRADTSEPAPAGPSPGKETGGYAATPTPPPPAAADPREGAAAAAAAIRAVVAGYARAIEGRSVAQMRELYPDMSPKNQNAWRDFITNTRDVRDLKAQFSARDIDASRTLAEAMVNGTITFRDYRNVVHTVRYNGRATLRNDSGRWRFVDIVETRTAQP